MDYPEPRRVMVGGQIESQALGIDQLLNEIFDCIAVGDSDDQRMGIDLPQVHFDRQRARDLIQNFMDRKLVGKSI